MGGRHIVTARSLGFLAVPRCKGLPITGMMIIVRYDLQAAPRRTGRSPSESMMRHGTPSKSFFTGNNRTPGHTTRAVVLYMPREKLP